MPWRPSFTKLLASFAICSLPCLPVSAQQWPSKLTRIVVPYLAGSSPDVQARLLADKLSKRTHEAFIVENKAGANSTIGTNFVARGPNDGTVMLFVDRLALTVNPLLYPNLPYDAKRDLASVSNVSDSKMYLVVNADFPASNFKEFVAYAKANPGKINFGSGGYGHISHLNLEAIQAGAGIQMLHVPYKGMADVVPALASGQVQVTVSGIGNFRPFLEQKRVRLLAIGSPQRSPLAPDVPTITEAGGTEDMLLSTGFSMHVRTGTPPDVIKKMSQDIAAVMADPDIVATFRFNGVDIHVTPPDVLNKLMDQEDKLVSKLVKERHIKVQ
jgi:tripartite-type tricarboxylate transporter receptor subunit TctC